MEQVQQLHDYLLQQRTQIRNHRRILQAMKACWKLSLRADPNTMTREEYEGMYATLLYEMTICWDEETNDAVLAKMWYRDASSFQSLDFNRFCCSIFYFAEVWVQEITQEAYVRIFNTMRTILAGHEFTPILLSADSPDPTCKPTLESFDNAFDHEREMESMNLNIGKSISFDASKYFQHFGSPNATTLASYTNLFQMEGRLTRISTLRSDLDEAYNRRYWHLGGGRAKVTKSGCSNPKLLRPASSRQSCRSVYDGHSAAATATPGSPPSVSRTSNNPFLLAGTIALKSPTNR